ncbi:MAG TPA: hypothetical protein DCS07_00885 [Bdellovibrionales bacterium]|nr:MAG: hypothetical protein A2X97_00055 [Bdellovibrionales bacterium GWA1_52_35]HAR41183.1 hypothetical protein [Bdellovibrionales bacterium]HCM41208.1 hypothetical protein [Bdellovibrionales bacterium]
MCWFTTFDTAASFPVAGSCERSGRAVLRSTAAEMPAAEINIFKRFLFVFIWPPKLLRFSGVLQIIRLNRHPTKNETGILANFQDARLVLQENC